MGFWRGWLEAWDGLEFDEELTDAGDNVLAAIKTPNHARERQRH